MKTALLTPLESEVAYRVASGMHYVSMPEFARRYADLGYRFDRSMDCTCNARCLTGERAGESYPCKTLYPVQDNGLSAFHVDARRDANFRALQALRNQCFSTSRGFIVEV